ncbi:MAG: Gfo/Idh/MocA family oxidoreductase, partial [Bacteroidales bacterium]|nr:Gfo/Idh/MocA family oxidoreductase [Candidatus Cryptobacteroides caccocaballi]
MKVGIIGAGWIAERMAVALNGLKRPDITCHAIASRSLEKAQAFARQWNLPKAYGSYEELVADPEIDLVYIATPHSHHYQHSVLAINAGKAVLCEKAFTANAREAEALLNLAHEKGVFITEA